MNELPTADGKYTTLTIFDTSVVKPKTAEFPCMRAATLRRPDDPSGEASRTNKVTVGGKYAQLEGGPWYIAVHVMIFQPDSFSFFTANHLYS